MTHDELAAVRHVVLDLDGTLYRGNRLFDETLPFLAKLRAWNIGCTFLTNNTSRSKADYVAKLRAFGIDANEGQIYTPADSAIAYLRKHLPNTTSIADSSRKRAFALPGIRRRQSWSDSIQRSPMSGYAARRIGSAPDCLTSPRISTWFALPMSRPCWSIAGPSARA
jgi:ribonucleotide monophosphatase NagD (HAD superfamily)